MKLLRSLVTACAWLYLAGVVGYAAALRLLGESFWLTTVLLYVPHVFLLVPGALLVAALAAVGPRRLILGPVAAGLVLVFAVMGLRPGLGGGPTPGGGPHLRVLTFNVDSGRRSIPEMVADIRDAAPDLVLLQESAHEVNVAVAAALPGFVTDESTQFFLASRFPILAAVPAPLVFVEGVKHSGRFMDYVIETPLGPLDVFSLHPISPRPALEDVRGSGLRHEVESGRLFASDRHTVIANTALRRTEVAAIADAARHAAHPVLIAGDTNLPDGSAILRELLAGYQDAFAEVGSGFGYTFPAHKRFAWMRIDRIFAGPELRFTSVAAGSRSGSDHRCVYADVERRP